MSGGMEACAREQEKKEKALADKKYKEDKAQWEHDRRVLLMKVGQCEAKKQQLLDILKEEDAKYEDVTVRH